MPLKLRGFDSHLIHSWRSEHLILTEQLKNILIPSLEPKNHLKPKPKPNSQTTTKQPNQNPNQTTKQPNQNPSQTKPNSQTKTKTKTKRQTTLMPLKSISNKERQKKIYIYIVYIFFFLRREERSVLRSLREKRNENKSIEQRLNLSRS